MMAVKRSVKLDLIKFQVLIFKRVDAKYDLILFWNLTKLLKNIN
jgi:hypothetical protein